MEGKQMEIISIIGVILIAATGSFLFVWRPRRYSPKKILKGSERANDLLPEVDKILGIILHTLEKRYGRMMEMKFVFENREGLTWSLECDPTKSYQLCCMKDGEYLYSYGRGRNKRPPLRTIMAVYRSLPKLIKQMTKKFPTLRGELDQLQEAAKL
jgi:hypothetical protein